VHRGQAARGDLGLAIATRALGKAFDGIPPAAGAVVMGTGIVSTALLLDRHETLSRILLAVGAGVWIGLAVVLADRTLREADRVRRDSRSPAALTGVAATGVLGARLTELGWRWAGVAALAIALVLWLMLLGPLLRNWATPTVGASLMLAVSTESLAVLAATLATRERAHWLLDAAVIPFVLGLAMYGFVISRFELKQLLMGRGDQWITGGALAISTLAAAQLTGVTHALKTASIVLWVATMAWLPILLVAEALRPRLDYDLRRWSTVFPVGMYAACSFAVGAAARSHLISDFAKIWVWVSLAVWLVVSAAMLCRLRRLA
jgi:tellurite resistance protein TehA-like permease